jgi:crossover junction endodeoxyribonuclease RuvC
MFVMGVDPGLSRCGYAVVEARRAGPRAVALGVITTPPSSPLPERLAELQRELRALIAEYRPVAVAVERVLFQVNVRTAMSVGQASGIAMAEAATAGCDVVQYSPNQVKDAVAGHGGAGKAQVQQMVQTLLSLAVRPEPPDAADAAALALTHLAFAASAVAVDDGPPVPGRPRNAVGRRAGPGVPAQRVTGAPR